MNFNSTLACVIICLMSICPTVLLSPQGNKSRLILLNVASPVPGKCLKQCLRQFVGKNFVTSKKNSKRLPLEGSSLHSLIRIYFQEAIMFSRVESVFSVSSLAPNKQTENYCLTDAWQTFEMTPRPIVACHPLKNTHPLACTMFHSSLWGIRCLRALYLKHLL